MLTEISCPPQTGRELAPDDQAVPDPVVVASAGPLPSATLHETAVSFRHECLDTFTIGKGGGGVKK